MKQFRFEVVGDEVVSHEYEYFAPGTKVVTTDPDSPLVPNREYTVEWCSENEAVCKLTQYHWPVSTGTLKEVS